LQLRLLLTQQMLVAAVCAEVYIADKAAFCSCGYCWRNKCWHLQRWSFCGAALFTEPAVQTGRSWLFSKWPFSAAFS